VTDYTSAAQVFAAITALESEVDARLDALVLARPSASGFVASVRDVRRRHERERERLRRRLRVPPREATPRAEPDPADLRGLREAQQALVHAHAEGLPALGDREAVDRLADHMVVLAGQLTVIDLWLEAEGDA
jgi:hypothetical protein